MRKLLPGIFQNHRGSVQTPQQPYVPIAELAQEPQLRLPIQSHCSPAV